MHCIFLLRQMKSFPDRLKWNTNCTSKHTNKTRVPREFSHQKIHRIFLLIWPWGNFNSQLISSARIAFISALARFSDRLLCVNGDHKNFVHFSRFDSFPVKRKKKRLFVTITCRSQESMKSKTVNPPYRLYTQGNPSWVIFRSLPI